MDPISVRMEPQADNHNDVITERIKKFGLARMSNFINENSTYCPKDIPSSSEYLSAINIYGITLFSLGALAVLVILFMFLDTLKYIMKHSSPRVKTYSAFVIGVYPIVALSTYVAILVPRAHLLAEAITQGTFMAAMYQLFCLFVAYCGGEAELIRKVKPDSLNPRVGPCCCLPCCCCLPSLSINKNRVRYLRLLVLQLPVVQGLVYATLLVLWAERESLYQVNYMYFQPLIIMSILFGVWGMTMTINLLKDVLDKHSMQGKFLVLQLVLLFAKLQALLTRIAVWVGLMPCKPPITPMVYGNLVHNTLMLAEMVLLSFIARKLYKKVLPDLDETPTAPKYVITTIGALISEHNNNTCSTNNNDTIKTAENKQGT
ncbi:Organic solute transporter Ostalpha [Popillia japonica]|uniref:Organic solute transporter Ostalpha n=1 Tax=Popillia japonica TaxID=7064 RepID=A0AAW1LAJ4_POPJA